VFEFSSLPTLLYESLDDDCNLSHGAKATFLERIFASFGLRHDDKEIVSLRRQLKALLCHNTDLKGKILHTIPSCIVVHFDFRKVISILVPRRSLQEFVALIRASNKPEDSPKTAVVGTLF
jgi:hypothetical protein